jgi:cephalosporin hydroxylase
MPSTKAIGLQVAADTHRYTYTSSWLGVPVIRLPDDICVLQELVWEYRPEVIVETGVARGGSMVLDASLQTLSGLEPRVLGIDIQILEHTRAALEDHPLSRGITLIEADWTSSDVREQVAQFVGSAQSALLILDSNHTHAHAHVLGELQSLAPLLPVGAYVLVADTLIEEFPAGYFADRPWDRGDNPLTATRQFLRGNSDFVEDEQWGRRGLLSEFRDGVLRRAT